jgi:hypothetical protein
MPDEPPRTPRKKATASRPIGSIDTLQEQVEQQERWRSIGGTATPQHQDPGIPGSQGPGTLETSLDPLSDHTSTRADKPERKRQVVYLYPDLYRWIRHRAADTDQELSDIVNEALQRLKDTLESTEAEKGA